MAKAKKQEAQVAGNVMFYTKPEPLNKEAHGKFGVKGVAKPFEFMSKQHFIPLTAQEFGAASSSYPVVFAGDDRTPIAIMGIRPEENLFVKEDGQFETDYYMPAFARRYPFVLANDNDNKRRLLCVDMAADCVTNKKPDQPFFDGENASVFTQDAIKFLEEFEQNRIFTDHMVARFKELDLFEMKDMHFQGQNADGSPAERQKIAEYFAVTDERLRALDEKIIKELNDNGMLAAAYAHMFSLANWQRLVNMTLRRAAAEQGK